MWVYGCFEGDNLTLALAQHDLYFGANLAREQWIGRHSSPSYLWAAALERVAQRASAVPWLARHRSRLTAIDSFSHKNVQKPHEHIAAYYRWQRRSEPVPDLQDPVARAHYLKDWRDYLLREIPALMRNDELLLSFAKMMLYRYLDASDEPSDRFDELLVERYGFECVALTWRSKKPRLVAAASRASQNAGQMPERSKA
jgi:hypothetical protein